jgi:ABC-type lipoprotein release transport system permease subunit
VIGLPRFPWSYPLRSVLVRWPASVFSAVGIAMTVAVLCGVFALQLGFRGLLSTTGSDDVILYMRPGATSEGESGVTLEQVRTLEKERPEIALDEAGRPLAAGESYLALFLPRLDGEGESNVPLRGVEPASFAIHGDAIEIAEGRRFTFGADEVIVGLPTTRRIRDCRVGDTLRINVTPFSVVGTFEAPGAYGSEIWGDVERITAALERPIRQRVVARLKPGVRIEDVARELEGDKRVPTKVMTERTYFASQTRLVDVLTVLGAFLTVVLGVAAVLGAANTMLAAVGSRTREVGMLRSMGFRRGAILCSFLLESALIGLAGGLLGVLLVLPLNGIETGTMNWNTFTENTFAFRVTPGLLVTAVAIAVGLGVFGGLVPAWRASRLPPVAALRRE